MCWRTTQGGVSFVLPQRPVTDAKGNIGTASGGASAMTLELGAVVAAATDTPSFTTSAANDAVAVAEIVYIPGGQGKSTGAGSVSLSPGKSGSLTSTESLVRSVVDGRYAEDVQDCQLSVRPSGQRKAILHEIRNLVFPRS